MKQESTLDVRGLEHHERPPLIIKEASKLRKNESFTLVVEIEPLPMINILKQRGYMCESEQREGYWKVRVTKI